jgi:protein-S-isoprenylcysteine O-methyltransferase
LRILGKQFTAAVLQVEGHQLITSGPYRWLRHPSYTGSLVSFFGNAIFLEAWLGLVITLACMGSAYFYRIKVEEMMLDKIFGQSYQCYRQHTWCVIPFLW